MQLTYRLNKPSQFVFDYLTDMQKFVSVHPVIFKMTKTYANTYLVYETLKFGFIPVTFKYTASVESDWTSKRVLIKATVMKFTNIEMHFVLTEEKDGTMVEESITFRSPLPIKPVMQAIFKKQHALLFKNIEKLLA